MEWYPPQTRVTLGLRDAEGSPTRMTLHMRVGLPYASHWAAVGRLRGIVIGRRLSLGRLYSATVSTSYRRIDTPPAPMEADSRCALLWLFSCEEAGQYAAIYTPAPLVDLLAQDGPAANVAVDLAHPLVLLLVAELTSGPWCNPFGHRLVELVACSLVVFT